MAAGIMSDLPTGGSDGLAVSLKGFVGNFADEERSIQDITTEESAKKEFVKEVVTVPAFPIVPSPVPVTESDNQDQACRPRDQFHPCFSCTALLAFEHSAVPALLRVLSGARSSSRRDQGRQGMASNGSPNSCRKFSIGHHLRIFSISLSTPTDAFPPQQATVESY